MVAEETWMIRAILLISCCVSTLNAGFTLEQGIPHFNTKPYFLPPPATNLTALEGQSAYLHCRVAQLGDKKVSWIRKRDLHVLTSGVQTFASDERFLALHADRSENWTLHIRFSQARDSGEYQCQVNTDPQISMLFTLTVKEAATLMDGSDQRYVRAGSTIKLSCKTSMASQPPGLLYWYRDSEILQSAGRVNITTQLENETVSNLTIQGARVSDDSGNYTCWPTKFLPASVMVHVIPEEKAAAKSQSGGSNGGGGSGGGSGGVGGGGGGGDGGVGGGGSSNGGVGGSTTASTATSSGCRNSWRARPLSVAMWVALLVRAYNAEPVLLLLLLFPQLRRHRSLVSWPVR